MTSLLALCVGLAGCATPGPDDVLKHAAAGKGDDGVVAVAAGNSSDKIAMQSAKDQLDQHVASVNAKAAVDLPVMPGVQQMTIEGPRSFAGIWRMVSPTTLTVQSGGDATYEHVQTFICRFDQHEAALTGACLPSRSNIKGEVDGKTVTLRWSRGLVSSGMSGTLLSPTDFHGILSIGAIGIRVPTDIPVYGTKLGSATAPHDTDQIAGPVLQELARGKFEPDDFTSTTAAELRDTPLFSERERQALGMPIDLILLDRIQIPANEEAPAQTMAAYDAEFEHGWRLCGVVVNSAQKVDRVECR